MALKPFYNKKGHLGMTRAELLEKLNGGGVYVVKIVWNEEAGWHETAETVAEIVAKAENANIIFAQTEGELNERYSFMVTYIDSTVFVVFGPDLDDPDNEPPRITEFLGEGLNYPYKWSSSSGE